ncbi:unnamed protein product [Fraxinus pennsylvanica]|uniref:SWIM-type domain-containing protein n=1 Tax=Fraxinus pennsylvanica TaxID=56036 RepID=A0AAD2E5C4_9LAMI|nr:unnamed protein product [Fraxinus pennsylvanica]
MESKKIIAICQSGGEFVVNEDDESVSYTGGEAYALDLDQQTQLKDFKHELSETFQCNLNGMTIKYFLPGNRKTLITISKDKDFQRMVNFFKDSDQVEIYVISEEVAAVQIMSNMPASRSSRTTSSEAVIPSDDPMAIMQDDDAIVLNEPIEIAPLDVSSFSTEERHRRAATQWENIITDFQKGLTESLLDIFGKECYHGYCLRYLAEKLNKDLKGLSHDARRLLVQDFYAAAYAPKLDAFERCVENIKAISAEAYDWVIRSEPDHWANAFFGGARYNHMTSNFGQQLYCWVSEVDEFPITQMVDVLRGKIMELIYRRRLESSEWVTRLTPCMEEKLQNESSKAHSLHVLLSHGSIFEVRSESVVDMVDIDNWDCSCRGWQLTGLPCIHAIAVFECIGRSPYDYCSGYFMTESYRLTYSESINLIPNVDKPELRIGIIVTPPPTKRPPGRPKLKSAESMNFIKRQLQCSKCKGLGHNKKTCNKVNMLEEPEPHTPILTGLIADKPEGRT